MATQPFRDQALAPWHDTTLSREQRVDALIAEMTLREKVAQLYGIWVGISDTTEDVAPAQHELTEQIDLAEMIKHGLGQLTRPFGSSPVDPAIGVLQLARTQRRIVEESRLGIPALAHEECLAGFTAWGATAYPVPLSWGATFNPALIAEMASQIGSSMRAVGIHQGLAPVLDVARDLRWGRVEETVGEDPYLVATITTAYVKALEQSGIVATLKHFAGYASSKGGRNLAPVSVGPRELADVVLPPFEMAVRETRVRSVMHAYVDLDGMPAAADRALLTGLLRDTWGFDGTVVADYFGITFLQTLHGVAATLGEAAAKALTAGVDVELPNATAYAAPLIDEVRQRRLDERVIDTALRRVLLQKLDLGLLEPDWDALPEGFSDADLDDPEARRGSITLDTDGGRGIARRIAEQAVVLVKNDGTLPLSAATTKKILVSGPTADDYMTLLGCYSFPSHVGAQHPEVPVGIEIATVLERVRAEFPDAQIAYEQGVSIDGHDQTGIARAAASAREHDLVIAALGDRSALFGRGTSGEGCDADSMKLPGVQQELLEALLDTGTPVVAVLVQGRPYALGTAPQRAAAILTGFLPGEEGAAAIAGVLSGRVNPSGRLPVTIPATPFGQPYTYLGALLAQRSATSSLDPTGAYPFGHGLSYTSFEWGEPTMPVQSVPTDGSVSLSVPVFNTGPLAGVEIPQLYLHDPVASVVRPVNRLIAYARVELEAGAGATVTFEVPADVTSFTGADGRRIVESGELELRLGTSSGDLRLTAAVELTGETRVVDHTRALHCDVRVSPLTDAATDTQGEDQ